MCMRFFTRLPRSIVAISNEAGFLNLAVEQIGLAATIISHQPVTEQTSQGLNVANGNQVGTDIAGPLGDVVPNKFIIDCKYSSRSFWKPRQGIFWYPQLSTIQSDSKSTISG